jgi:hypothetical protein
MADAKKKTPRKTTVTRETETATPEEILAQCLIALGQGAGDLFFSPSGVRVVRESYMRRISDYAASWNEDAPSILNQARAMGRIAADIASAGGASIVNGESMTLAMRRLEEGLTAGRYWPLGCRWCV